jgi:hypothetical protein
MKLIALLIVVCVAYGLLKVFAGAAVAGLAGAVVFGLVCVAFAGDSGTVDQIAADEERRRHKELLYQRD